MKTLYIWADYRYCIKKDIMEKDDKKEREKEKTKQNTDAEERKVKN